MSDLGCCSLVAIVSLLQPYGVALAFMRLLQRINRAKLCHYRDALGSNCGKLWPLSLHHRLRFTTSDPTSAIIARSKYRYRVYLFLVYKFVYII